MSCKISIITITFNSEKTLEETILSVIHQNYSNLEYIIIDGGSTDSTLDIVNKYKPYISKIISEPDKGISDAFNKGIRLASGDVIGIINSDDLLNINALNKLDDILKKYPNYDVYYGNGIIFDEKHNHIYKPMNQMNDILKHMFLCHPATFVRKDAYEKYGLFDVNYKCAMDFELLSKMYISGAKFKYIDYEFTWFRLGGVSRKKAILTNEESVSIAIRNGIHFKEAKSFYRNVARREKILNFFNKIGLETILRKILKKQLKANTTNKWYIEQENNQKIL